MSLLRKKIVLEDGFRVGVITSSDTFPLFSGRVPTPVVFCHGWSVSAAAYTEMLEHLAKHFHPVIALDAADHGDSDSLPWGHSVADMARVTYQALKQLGIDKAIMVGHSMGGGMVAEFAARYPERTEAAILIDAAAGQHHHEALQMALTPEGLLRAAELITGALRDIVADARMAAESRSVTELLSLGKQLAKSLSGPPVLKAGIALLRHDTSIALHKMKIHNVPTVVIHGGDDRIISERAALQAAQESGGRLHIMCGRNHSWMIADAALAASTIADHARRIVRKIA